MRISDWSSDVCSSDLRGFFRLEPEFGCASEIVFGLFGVEVGKRVVLNIARRIRRRIVERCADTNMFVRPIVLTLLTGHRRDRKKESDHLHTRTFQPVVPSRSLPAQQMPAIGKQLGANSLPRVAVATFQKCVGI